MLFRSRGCAVRSAPERMCVCSFVRSLHLHVRENTCDVDKDEPMCSARFEYSLCVRGYVRVNVYVIVCGYDAMLEEGNG